MRIGVFGGSFDPVHNGHLLLAERARESLRLDKVLFLPAAISPHKLDRNPAPDAARAEMLQLAIGGHEAFELERCELDRGGVSYTADTLEFLAGDDPSRELILLMGADALADLPAWHRPERVCELALIAVVARAGGPAVTLDALRPFVPEPRLQRMEGLRVMMPLIELSSSDIRQRTASRQSIRYMLPRAVEKYIETQKLYQ